MKIVNVRITLSLLSVFNIQSGVYNGEIRRGQSGGLQKNASRGGWSAYVLRDEGELFRRFFPPERRAFNEVNTCSRPGKRRREAEAGPAPVAGIPGPRRAPNNKSPAAPGSATRPDGHRHRTTRTAALPKLPRSRCLPARRPRPCQLHS